MIDVIVEGENFFGVFSNFVKFFVKVVLEVVFFGSGLFGGIFGMVGIDGKMGGFFGLFFGGFCVNGGFVVVGISYVVGERGKEFFVLK